MTPLSCFLLRGMTLKAKRITEMTLTLEAPLKNLFTRAPCTRASLCMIFFILNVPYRLYAFYAVNSVRLAINLDLT